MNRRLRDVDLRSKTGLTPSTILHYLAVSLFFITVVYIGYIPQQSDFGQIIIPYTISFGCYWYFLKVPPTNLMSLVILAILVRFILIFAFPHLSDDIYRFIWDGRMMHEGMNPYSALPSEVVNQYGSLQQDLFNRLNSPNYYSIYPPVNQLINYIATLFSSSNYVVESIIYKSFLFIGELALIRYFFLLMGSLNLDTHRSLIYMLNPLVIIEVMGNAHFEGIMVLFLIAAFYHLSQNYFRLSGGLFSLSIAFKL